LPETYPGQTEVVRTKLHQAELLMQANHEQLSAATDPDARANLLRLIAGQTLAQYVRAKCGLD